MQRCSGYQLQISKPLTLFTPFIILKAIRNHGRPIKTGSPKQPLHFRSRLMSTTNAFMNLSHINSSLVRVQTFEKQIFGSSTIKFIINQIIFKCHTLNFSLCTTTKIFKIGDCWLSLALQINPQAYGYQCSFHLGVFQGIESLRKEKCTSSDSCLSRGYDGSEEVQIR